MSRFITPAVLKAISGKSKAEVEFIAAAYDAKGAAPDRTRPVLVPKAVALPHADADADGLRSEVDGSAPISSPRLRSEVASAPLEFEQKWKIEAVISEEIKAKLDKCKSLLSRKYPHGVDYDVLLGELAQTFLEQKDPERKQQRRKQREARKKPASSAATKKPDSRHIPSREKEKVWIRDKGKCTYVGTNGKRCNSTHCLQFDHFPVPFARGGPSKAGNLRLLCAKHNRYTAAKICGYRNYSKSPVQTTGRKGVVGCLHRSSCHQRS